MRIGERVKEYIMAEYLPDTDPGELTYQTPLISSGIIDSLAALSLRSFVEDTFDVSLESHELDYESFGTLADIETLIEGKIEEPGDDEDPILSCDR